MSGVPWYFCKDSQCYRVRPGFRFPGLDRRPEQTDSEAILPAAQQLLEDGEKFMKSLRCFIDALNETVRDDD